MKFIRIFQNILIGISLLILSVLPLLVAFGDMRSELIGWLYLTSFILVFVVMLIRPLADIFSSVKIFRKVVCLRKGFGILSASIVVGFMIGKIIAPESQYIMLMFTSAYWSLENCVVFAHIGDITGLILLLTSNNFSMLLLKKNWKRIQKLAYVYFYAGGIYEACSADSVFSIVAMTVVTTAVIVAFFMNYKNMHHPLVVVA